MRENKYGLAHVFYYTAAGKNSVYKILCWINDPYIGQITSTINSYRTLLNDNRYEYRRK